MHQFDSSVDARTATLGAKLARNRELHANRNTEYLCTMARRHSAQALDDFNFVEGHLNAAKVRLQELIENGQPRPEVPFGALGTQEGLRLERLLLGQQTGCKAIETLATDRHPFFCLWRDFQAWSAEQELKITLVHRNDDLSHKTWFILQAAPTPASLPPRT